MEVYLQTINVLIVYLTHKIRFLYSLTPTIFKYIYFYSNNLQRNNVMTLVVRNLTEKYRSDLISALRSGRRKSVVCTWQYRFFTKKEHNNNTVLRFVDENK